MPAISVIVPVYNVEQWLLSCIDSILLQTFSDFECILVDDGSPDTSPMICDDYAQRDSRITVIHQKNCGVTSARKTGIEHAHGDYVCFVDGDDSLPEHALFLLYERATSQKLDILVTAKNEIKNGVCSVYQNVVTGIVPLDRYIEALLLGQCAIGPHGRLIKKNLFVPDILNIPRNITNNEDLVMNLRLALQAGTIGIYNDIITYNYCIHGGGASSKGMKLSAWLSLFTYCDDIMKSVSDSRNLNKALLRFKLRRIKALLRSYI
ncbi:MAG: glycosyltransferase [Treponema sp.]|jgi:glycosyltransferase involved in cell wall biosynthesis|nr:glycosyltransferase [Treponema sp.]